MNSQRNRTLKLAVSAVIAALYAALTIALAGAIAYFAWPAAQSPQEGITDEQRYAIMQEQQVFAAWYESYQKDLNELDRNWQWYHHILESFKEDNISLQTVYSLLKQLEQDSNQLRDRMAARKVPLELSDYTYDQTAQLLHIAPSRAQASGEGTQPHSVSRISFFASV